MVEYPALWNNFAAMLNRATLLILCLLLTACAQAPVAQSPGGLFRDELFAAPSQRISADEVFALSEAMERYVKVELAEHHYKGRRQALIDAVSQGQLRLEYDSVSTRNAAEAFDAKAGNCLSLVIMTAAFAKVRGRLDDAYWLAREAMRQSPGYWGSYNTLGVVYLRRGLPDAAELAFRRVLEHEPENTRAWANLALTLDKLGRPVEAAAADRELARIERHAPFHFFHLGIAAMEAGDFKAARAAFAREVRRAPEYHEFHFWLGLAELRLGNVEAARAELAVALEHSSTRRDHDLYAAKLDRLSTQRH